MAKENDRERLSRLLGDDISNVVGMPSSDELGILNNSDTNFFNMLKTTLDKFTATSFDVDSFSKRFSKIDLPDKQDQEAIKNILWNVERDYIGNSSLNNNDLLIKRDIQQIVTQMPEMRDVIYIIRDAIIESDIVTGEVARSFKFQNSENASNLALIEEIERINDLQMRQKNTIIPQTLMNGEYGLNVVPYRKLFAELEVLHDLRYNNKKGTLSWTSKGYGTSIANSPSGTVLRESKNHHDIYSIGTDDNFKYIKEHTNQDIINNIQKVVSSITNPSKNNTNPDKSSIDNNIKALLNKISVYPDNSSVLIQELGPSGVEELLKQEINNSTNSTNQSFLEYYLNHTSDDKKKRSFFEATINGIRIDDNDVPYEKYKDVKGCYIKYLDPIRLLPIRLDRKVIGYYYVTSVTDADQTPYTPNGVVDISLHHFSRNREVADALTDVIVKSFDKKVLDNNSTLKSEIATVVMEHKFNEGRLTFTYIPENEVIRFVINEDEYGKGHSVLEPSLVAAKQYLMLDMFNMLYTLNNTTTRVHYFRSSGLTSDYNSLIQSYMRKIQSRRITMDDIFNYSNAMNKIVGTSEVVMPSGKSGNDKSIDTDTIQAVENPVNNDYLERKKREAISGTSVPALMVINSTDEVEFAKQLELANTRFLSAISSYKIDFNRGFTKLYQTLLRYNTDIPDSEINSFKFQFANVKQQSLNTTNDMINNFNALYELKCSMYFRNDELTSEDSKDPSDVAIMYKRLMAEQELPMFDDNVNNKLADLARLKANEMSLRRMSKDAQIDEEDVEEIKDKAKNK